MTTYPCHFPSFHRAGREAARRYGQARGPSQRCAAM